MDTDLWTDGDCDLFTDGGRHGPWTSIPGELPAHGWLLIGAGHDTASTGKTKYRPYFENYTVDASILETARHNQLRPSLGCDLTG